MRLLFLLLLGLSATQMVAQDCIGGQLYSQEAYLYGRFEVAMKSAEGSGVVSSFFLYNLDSNCNWPDENNELDIEMTGNTADLYFTTHYPGPWYFTDIYTPAFNPHNAIHDYAFEWEPGIVRWFVDGVLVNVQDQSFVDDLIHPMRIMMNLWAAEAVTWVGPWDPSIMPVSATYDYVRYYAYTPGNGTTGTGNNFSPIWEDNFDGFDSSRWVIEQDGGFNGNYCRFRQSSVNWTNGQMIFQLEEEPNNPESIPVTFSVNTESLSLLPGDIINLNGSFNNWCGNCMPMTQNGDIWSRTINLEPGTYEFLFAKNLWEETGGAPLSSSCDFVPCDEYGNYGFIVVAGSNPITLETPCWATCTNCNIISGTEEFENNSNKQVLKIYDLLGREVLPVAGQVLFFLYDDGTVEKKVFLNN
ncbi:MAG: family 16 glycosylhydrolase [Saprospiraceae bacterium]|nr:family 16 glycosylhydrolase [Saprospiraceae bacterium]